GAAWKLPITWRHNDNTVDCSTGYTVAFVATISPAWPAVLSLTETSGITLGDGASGPNIVVSRTATQTALLAFVRAWCRLDNTRTADGFTWRLLEGSLDLD